MSAPKLTARGASLPVPMVTCVTIALCDVLNPGLGYSIRIHGDNDRTLLFTAHDPVNGKDLVTYADALRVASYYTDAGRAALRGES